MSTPADETFRRPDFDESYAHNGHLKVFNHHVYEYRKGLRHLALQTLPEEHESWVTSRLERLDIAYLIYPAGKQHVNVFLGDAECLEVIRAIGKFDLSHYTPEEDFMLGIMLGYGRRQQCARYMAQVRRGCGQEDRLPEGDHMHRLRQARFCASREFGV